MSAVHPAAAVWPMLSEPDLRRLADDIKANGLLYPVVVDDDDRVLDGRNRLAACRIAGVEPTFEKYTGDPVARVLSANNERRHLSLPERAAATALTLATNGHRVNGRWAQGTADSTSPNSDDRQSWSTYLSRAGLVLDHAPDLLPKVAAGTLALDAAVKRASDIKAEQKRRTELPDDLGALVDSGELSLTDALRRNALTADYAARVAAGALALDEAEHLSSREFREHQEAISRHANRLLNFLDGYTAAATLANDPNRDDALAALSDFDRDRLLRIEKEITWPSTRI